MRFILSIATAIALSSAFIAKAEGPRLQLLDKELDLGSFSKFNPKSGTIRYKNVGDSALVLLRVTADCGCTGVRYSREPLPPDSIGEIRVTFDGNGRPEGKFRKMIRIRSNSDNGTEAAFITGHIKRSLVR